MKTTTEDCKDPKCPIHGALRTRGAMLTGVVVSDKAKKTAIIEIGYTKFLPKYERYLRKKSRIAAYSPLCIGAKTGDTVTIKETRKVSKTKSFAVTGIVKRGK